MSAVTECMWCCGCAFAGTASWRLLLALLFAMCLSDMRNDGVWIGLSAPFGWRRPSHQQQSSHQQFERRISFDVRQQGWQRGEERTCDDDTGVFVRQHFLSHPIWGVGEVVFVTHTAHTPHRDNSLHIFSENTHNIRLNIIIWAALGVSVSASYLCLAAPHTHTHSNP